MKRVFLIFTAVLFILPLSAQDSLNMKRMAELSGMGTEYTDIWGYRHGSKEFGIIGSRTSINIVDVTDCGNPVLVHQWVDGTNTSWRDFKEYGDYIYAVCDGGCTEGLQVINKNDYSQSQSTAQFTKAHNIFIEKESGRLYACGTNTLNEGLYIYDIKTDPANPALIKALNFNDVGIPAQNYYVHDLYVKNDTAYCSHGNPGLRIWDLTDLNNVTMIAHAGDETGGYNHSSWKHETEPYLYLAEELPKGKPIYVYDLSEITDPFIEYEFKDPLEAPDYEDNRPHNPFVLRDRLYISYYHDGIQVYDLEDPALPVRIAYYDTYLDNNSDGYGGTYSFEGSWGTYPYLPSGCILASDITYGLSTFELTIPPDTDNTMPSNDIIVDNDTKGIVFRTPDEEYIRVTLNNQFKLSTEIIAGPPASKIEFRNSNLKFTSQLNGVILKNPNEKYVRIGVDNDGALELNQVLTLPTNAIKLNNEDVYFKSIRGGIKMTSPDGSCYHYTLGEGGVEEVTTSDCD